jgi:hypothetical protein
LNQVAFVLRVSGREEASGPYSYTFKTSAQVRTSTEAADKAARDAVVSIKETMLLLTGICDVVERNDGTYCEKHQRRVKRGDTRCDYIAERLAEGQDKSKKQIQEYVNDVLGIRDPRIAGRLTGGR